MRIGSSLSIASHLSLDLYGRFDQLAQEGEQLTRKSRIKRRHAGSNSAVRNPRPSPRSNLVPDNGRGREKKRRGLEGKLRKDNILPHPFRRCRTVSLEGTSRHSWKPAKFALIVPRIGFARLRQQAFRKMLRPYRHWMVKDILDRRLGIRSGKYLRPFHKLSVVAGR